MHGAVLLPEEIIVKEEVAVHSEQYKAADVSVRLDLVTMATKHFLIGILSFSLKKNTCYIPHRSWKLKKVFGGQIK